MTSTTIPIALHQDHSQLTEFAAKEYSGKICLSPFVSIAVSVDGDVSLCNCHAWMPSIVGNLFQHSLVDILSNHYSRQIRASILDGSYRYCNEKNCGIISAGLLNTKDTVPPEVRPLLDDAAVFKMPNEIVIAGDRTCNLSCPSCRTEVIKTAPAARKKQQQLGQILHDNLFSMPSSESSRLHISTSGELFASAMLLAFVDRISPEQFPGLRLCIQTNGLLAQKNWHRLNRMQDRVSQVTVTTDAATPATYERLRRGGRWKHIQQALHWISHLKQQQGFDFYLRMVVQQANFQEMDLFYQQALALDCDRVEFSRLTDWYTYASPEHFLQQDVFDSRHPEHAEALQMYHSLRTRDRVFFNNGFP